MQLEQFNSQMANIGILKQIVEESKSPYAQYLAASALKTLLADNWLKIPQTEKVSIKNYLVGYLMNSQVVHMQSPQEK